MLISMASYNIRSLRSRAAGCPFARAGKAACLANLRELAEGTDIVFIQETNLPLKDHHYLQKALPGHLVYCNNSPLLNTAGTAFILKRCLLKTWLVEACTSVRGYSQVLHLNPKPGHQAALAPPVSVFGVYLPLDATIRDTILANFSLPLAPRPNLCRFLLGDFNFVQNPCDAAAQSAHYTISPGLRSSFGAVLAAHELVELPQPSYTFHRRRTTSGGAVSRDAARLDRIYGAIPEGLLEVYQPIVRIAPLSRMAHRDDDRRLVSDHDAVQLRFFSPRGTGGDTPPFVPRWVLTDPGFRATYEALAHKRLRASADPAKRLMIMRKAILDAASFTARSHREALPGSLADIPLSDVSFGRRLLDAAIASDAARVRRLLALGPAWDAMVLRTGPGPTYRVDALVAHLSTLYRPRTSVPLAPPSFTPLGGPDRARFGAFRSPTPLRGSPGTHPLRRLSRLLPSARQLLLRVVTPAGLEITEAEGIATQLHAYWGSIWRRQEGETARETAAAWLRGTKPICTTSAMARFATPSAIADIIAKTNDSAPGPDGIPFAAYRVLGPLVAPIIADFVNALGDGTAMPPPGFNNCLLFCLPKKGTGAVADTRPISVPDALNRIISSFAAQQLTHGFAGRLHPSQRAGLPGLLISDNVVEINEWFCRLAAARSNAYLCLVDFAKAFDSVGHEFILAVLKAYGVPPFFLRLFVALLNDVTASPVVKGQRFADLAISVGRGVKQGDPCSPLIFCIVMNSLLVRVSALLPDDGILGGYMDDVAIGFVGPSAWVPITQAFDEFGDASGLRTNLSKTMLLPTCKSVPQAHLAVFNSAWKVRLEWKGKYLGVLIGLDVTIADIFEPAALKFEKRILDLMSWKARFSVPRRVLIANVFLIPIFSYLSQFYLMPATTLDRVKRALGRWLIPLGGSAFPLDSLTRPLDLFGLARPLVSPLVASLSLLAKRWPDFAGRGIHASRRSIRIGCHVQMARRMLIDHRTPACWGAEYSIVPRAVRAAYLSSSLATQAAAARIRFLLKRRGLPPRSDLCLAAWRALPSVGDEVVRYHYFAFFHNALAVKSRRLSSILRRSRRGPGELGPCALCNAASENRRHVFFDCIATQRAILVLGGMLKWDWVARLSWGELHLLVAGPHLARKACFVVALVAAVWRALMLQWVMAPEAVTIASSATMIVSQFADVLTDSGRRWETTCGPLHPPSLRPVPSLSPRALALPPPLSPASELTAIPEMSSESTTAGSDPWGEPEYRYHSILGKRRTRQSGRYRGPRKRRRYARRPGDFEFQVLWRDGSTTWEPFCNFNHDDPHVLRTLSAANQLASRVRAKSGLAARPPEAPCAPV